MPTFEVKATSTATVTRTFHVQARDEDEACASVEQAMNEHPSTPIPDFIKQVGEDSFGDIEDQWDVEWDANAVPVT